MSAYPTSQLPRRARLLAGCALAAALAGPAYGDAFLATPTTVVGGASITRNEAIGGGNVRDTVRLLSRQTVINWVPTDTGTGGGAITVLGAGNELLFSGNNNSIGNYTVLNRVVPVDPSRPVQMDGIVRSQFDTGYGAPTTGGNIWFYSPGGIILGGSARFDVGTLVLSANDIDITNGLYGNGTQGTNGTIRFRGAQDSRSAVIVSPNAQLTASGNYVALVAPRIDQGGLINVNGSAALVAAESANITIPVGGNLLDIVVQTGSAVNPGGETTLTHSGTTQTNDIGATGAARRVYVMAVPKNDAVTMLVSGNLGYSAAQEATLGDNGTIFLTTGTTINGDFPFNGEQGTIQITGGNIRGRSFVSAPNITINTNTASQTFTRALDINALAGTFTVAASAGRSVNFGGFLTLEQFGSDTVPSTISFTASNAGTIQLAGASIRSNTRGFDTANAPATAGRGGTISVIASDGGIITSSGPLNIQSNGFGGGSGSNTDGGDGYGGTVTLAARFSGEINVTGQVSIDAEGFGGESGYGGGLAGGAFGGTINIEATGGSSIQTAGLVANAGAEGASARFSAAGGDATGGTINVTLNQGQLGATGYSFAANGFATDAGADGTGGVINIAATNSSTIIGSGGNFFVNAVGNGGDSFFADAPAGNGTGGTINLTVTNSGLTLGEGSMFLTTDGIGGASFVPTDVTGRGGTIVATIDTNDPNNVEASFQANEILLKSDGMISEPSFDLRDAVPQGNSGMGVGGSSLLIAAGGNISTGGITISASGTGDNGSYGVKAGSGYAGRAELRLAGGEVNSLGIELLANATGGSGAFGEIGYGDASDGGDAGIGAHPFGIESGAYLIGTAGALNASSVILSADATGGYGGDGQVNLNTTPVSAGNGGEARAGVATFQTSGVSMSVDSLTVTAFGTGGFGGDVNYPASNNGPQDANAGNAGIGTGGFATFDITGGDSEFALVNIDARGRGGEGGNVFFVGNPLPSATSAGGDGGQGSGGEATLRFTDATVRDREGLSVNIFADGSSGSGGFGARGGDAGVARGGTALALFDGGIAAPTQIRLSAYADAGDGGAAFRLAGGSGGEAFGGNATVTLDNGATLDIADGGQADPFRMDVSAYGGFGADGGVPGAAGGQGGSGGFGGAATAGNATINVFAGSTLTAPGVGDVESSPPTMIANAVGGDGGAGGNGTAAGNSGGIGGDGGQGNGGNAVINVTGGQADFGNLLIEASATGGFGGSGGVGGNDPVTGQPIIAARGGDYAGIGGQAKILVADDGTQVGGFTAQEFTADLTGTFVDGGLEIADTGALAGGGILFDSLSANSQNFSFGIEGVGNPDYLVRSTARRITVNQNAFLTSGGDMRFQFTGTGGIDVGGALYAQSLARGIYVTHDQQTNPLTPSITADTIDLRGYGNAEAQDGSLLSSRSSIFVESRNGSTYVANAVADSNITVTAFEAVTVGSLTAGTAETEGSIYLQSGLTEGIILEPVTVFGTVRATGDVEIVSGGDTIIASGASVISDNGLYINAGDDILVNSGALLRAANDPLPENGYGSNDPLEQRAALRLFAGFNNDPSPTGADIGSIILAGTLEAPDRTILIEGNAVSGTDSVMNGGKLYVRLSNIPPGNQTPRTDSGLLTGVCLEGSVCLGNVNITDIVRIGEPTFVPINLRLKGGIDANDVLLRGQSVVLGETGASHSIASADQLTIESLGSDLVLNGQLAISNEGSVTRIASAQNIVGAGATIETPGQLDIYARTNITLAGIDAQTIRTIDFEDSVSNPSGITLPGTAAIGDLRSGSNILVDAGTVTLGNLVVTGSGTLRSIGALRLDTSTVSGDLTMNSESGGITLGAAAANGAMTATTTGTLTVTGRTRARTIAFTSRDIAIGANGMVGDSSVTTGLTLTGTSDQMFLGDATGNGYRLDADEFRRIASRGSIAIVANPISRQDTVYQLQDPATATMVVGSLVFDGSQLGGENTISFESPRSIGITGNVRFQNFGSVQAVTFRASNDIALAAETGLMTIKNANGGLAGTLTLDAQQVHAMSARARSDIANLDLAAARQRLATNDGQVNDDGFLQANRINVRISRLVFIQNSGVNNDRPNDKRGFTTNNLTISAGEGTGQIVIHGKIGTAIGEGIIAASNRSGNFDAQSGFNTCLIGVPCAVVVEPPPPPPPPPPVYDFTNVLSSQRDQVKSEQDEDDKEEALQAAQARPDPIIQFVDAPPSRFDPLVDEPVTGAGNEDFWEPLIPTTPGPTP